MVAAVPIVGPALSLGLIAASAILPSIIELAADNYNGDLQIIDAGLGAGTGEHTDFSLWFKSDNESNLFHMIGDTPSDEWKQLALPSRLARVGNKLREVSRDVRSLLKHKQPLVSSHIKILQKVDFTYLTVVPQDLAFVKKVFYYLHKDTTIAPHRASALLALDPSLPLIEGSSLSLGSNYGKVSWQCVDNHLAGQDLPDSCWDHTKLGGTSTLSVDFVQDTHLVKFLGKGSIEIKCPEGRWNGFGVGVLVAIVTPHCRVTVDHKDAFTPQFETRGLTWEGAIRGGYRILLHDQGLISNMSIPFPHALRKRLLQVCHETLNSTDYLVYAITLVTACILIALTLLTKQQCMLKVTQQTLSCKGETDLRAVTGEEQGPPTVPQMAPLPVTRFRWADAQPAEGDLHRVRALTGRVDNL